MARLEMKAGTVELEITADYGGNPLLQDEDEARRAVKSVLQVRSGGQVASLQDLAPVSVENRSQWDPDAPTSFSPPPEGEAHQLVTAIWRWRPGTQEIVLGVPEGSLHDVLLWTRDDNLPGRQAKWMMLIEGESTPNLRVEHAAAAMATLTLTLTAGPGLGWVWITLCFVLMTGLGVWLCRPRRGR